MSNENQKLVLCRRLVHISPEALRALATDMETQMKQGQEGDQLLIELDKRIMLVSPPIHHSGK